jgi:hypothetical protein
MHARRIENSIALDIPFRSARDYVHSTEFQNCSG